MAWGLALPLGGFVLWLVVAGVHDAGAQIAWVEHHQREAGPRYWTTAAPAVGQRRQTANSRKARRLTPKRAERPSTRRRPGAQTAASASPLQRGCPRAGLSVSLAEEVRRVLLENPDILVDVLTSKPEIIYQALGLAYPHLRPCL